jgi:hypothetical protein
METLNYYHHKLSGEIVSFVWDGLIHIGQVARELANGVFVEDLSRKIGPRNWDDLNNSFFPFEEIGQLTNLTNPTTYKLMKKITPKKTSPEKISVVEQEFIAWWQMNGHWVSLVLSEYKKVIVLVPGRRSPCDTRLNRGKKVTRDNITLSAHGLSKANLSGNQFATGAPMSSREAIEAFYNAFPDGSFMDSVKDGIP